MEPTQVKSGRGGDLAPAVGQALPVQAYERSPTLLAGEVAGSQGHVRIWAPSRKMLWFSMLGFSLNVILFTLLAIVIHNPVFLIFMLPTGALATMAALRRPPLVVTDDAGIGITTRKGSRSLRWEEIRTARGIIGSSSDNDVPRIYLQTPDPVEIKLSGFPAPVQNELMDTIITRAQLQPHPTQKRLFLNPAAPPAKTKALMEAGDQDIRDEIAAGRKIQAIKLYRTRYGEGLKESKEAIDALAQSIALQKGQPPELPPGS